MTIEEICEKGISCEENFFYGEVLEVKKLYEFPEGVFCQERLVKDMELLWGVNDLKDLRIGIKKIKKENPDISFIFRYGSSLNRVIEKK